MTRHSFGGGTADFVQEVDNQGVVHAGNGATCTFFTAQTGGTAIVDLTDMASNPITSVSADANGGVPPFMGPDDGTSAMWVSAGGSARQLMQATDIPARIIALETGGGGGGGGTVTSVNGVSPVSGAVTLTAADVGADPAGSATTAQSNAEAASDPAGTAATAANNAQAAAEAASFSLNPVQRGLWAPTTAYALGDIAISPTGDIITPKTPFTTGAAYSATNWNILVPAQNYGRELTGAESATDFNLLGLSGWQDVPGMTGSIPAGIPFVCEINALCAALQGTAADGSITGVQLRVVDSATATTVFGFAWRQFAFAAASGEVFWQSVSGLRRGAGLGATTAVKMQAQIGAVAGQGNIGMFPASGGGGEPTTFVVRGR